MFWFLTVVQNAIILWNALSLEDIIPEFQKLSEEDLKRTLPTMTGHINFIGQFKVDFNRRPPFKLKQLMEYGKTFNGIIFLANVFYCKFF